MLSIGVICRLFFPSLAFFGVRNPGMKTYSNFHNISSDKVEVLQTAEDGPQLTGGPATGLRSSSGRGKGRVEGVNIDKEVDRVLGADALNNALDDAVSANGVDLTSLNNLETAVTVVLVVAGTREGSADTGVDAGVVGEETLHGGVVEVGSVVDGRNCRRGSTEDLGLPGVEMAVKVDDGDGTVSTVDGAQKGEGDGVVTAKGDDTGEDLALKGATDGRAGLVSVGDRGAGENVEMAFLNLTEGEGVIVRGDGDITAVENSSPAVEGVGLQGDVIPAVQVKAARALANAGGAEAGTGTVRGAGVEGGADKGDVVAGILGLEAVLVRQAAEGGNTREDRVGLGAAVTGEGVVPEGLVRASHGLLGVVAVGNGHLNGKGPAEAQEGKFGMHGCLFRGRDFTLQLSRGVKSLEHLQEATAMSYTCKSGGSPTSTMHAVLTSIGISNEYYGAPRFGVRYALQQHRRHTKARVPKSPS